MLAPLLITFAAAERGLWRILRNDAIVGDKLPTASHLDLVEGAAAPDDAVWRLRGVISNTRYTERQEVDGLAAVQQGLHRPEATCAALIPIRKNAAWWALAQDERRAIFEAQSRHIGIGLDYLPAIARRLHHCRDLGEPFDFLTWFEYAPEHADAFEHLVERLRATEEWRYVDREIDIRLSLIF